MLSSCCVFRVLGHVLAQRGFNSRALVPSTCSDRSVGWSVSESKQKLLECDHAIFVPIHFFCTRVINKNRLYFDPSSFSKIMQVSSIFTHRFSNTKQLEFKIEMDAGNLVTLSNRNFCNWNVTILIQKNCHGFLMFLGL